MAKRASDTVAWNKLEPREFVDTLREQPSINATELQVIQTRINALQGNLYTEASQILLTLEISREAGNSRKASRDYRDA